MHSLKPDVFINNWWNSSAPLSFAIEEGVSNSYLESENFWKSIFSLQENLLPPSQSYFGKAYNFYHDCVLRHIKRNTIAFSVVGNKYPDNWTYEKIHTCVNYHVDKWASDELKPGDVIAIVGAPNIHFILALLTSFRFGLKISYLPTNSPLLGKGQIIKFLSLINPKFIATEDPTTFLQEGVKYLAINENGSDDENYEPRSYAYPESSEVQIALSLQQQEALALTPLDAHKAYLHALREALVTLNLTEHPYWAMPLACPIQNEPCSTLMAFLAGITKIYVEDEVITKSPRIIQDERIYLLGVSSALQQLWSQEPGVPTRYLKYFYKSPLDQEGQVLKSFLHLNRLEKVPRFDVIMDNAMGGAILFSRPTLDPYNVFLKPTLGTSWFISHINGSGQESLTGFGVYEMEQSLDGNYFATQSENHLILTGVVEPARYGVTFPIDQLEKIVAELPFVEDCMLHPIQKAGAFFSHNFILFIFVNPLKDEFDAEKWTEEIRRHINTTLGHGYFPDKIEYFSLVPRKNSLGLDRNWCANQYSSGLLLQKKDFSQYKLIGALKKLIQEFS